MVLILLSEPSPLIGSTRNQEGHTQLILLPPHSSLLLIFPCFLLVALHCIAYFPVLLCLQVSSIFCFVLSVFGIFFVFCMYFNFLLCFGSHSALQCTVQCTVHCSVDTVERWWLPVRATLIRAYIAPTCFNTLPHHSLKPHQVIVILVGMRRVLTVIIIIDFLLDKIFQGLHAVHYESGTM